MAPKKISKPLDNLLQEFIQDNRSLDLQKVLQEYSSDTDEPKIEVIQESPKVQDLPKKEIDSTSNEKQLTKLQIKYKKYMDLFKTDLKDPVTYDKTLEYEWKAEEYTREIRRIENQILAGSTDNNLEISSSILNISAKTIENVLNHITPMQGLSSSVIQNQKILNIVKMFLVDIFGYIEASTDVQNSLTVSLLIQLLIEFSKTLIKNRISSTVMKNITELETKYQNL